MGGSLSLSLSLLVASARSKRDSWLEQRTGDRVPPFIKLDYFQSFRVKIDIARFFSVVGARLLAKHPWVHTRLTRLHIYTYDFYLASLWTTSTMQVSFQRRIMKTTKSLFPIVVFVQMTSLWRSINESIFFSGYVVTPDVIYVSAESGRTMK